MRNISFFVFPTVDHAFFKQAQLQGLLSHYFFQIAGLPAQVLDFISGVSTFMGAVTSVKADANSLTESMSSISSSQWSLGIEKVGLFNKADVAAFSINQAFRVESGVANVSDVTGRAHSGFEFATRVASLAPEAREINIEAAYGLVSSKGCSVNVNTVYHLNQSNINGNGAAGMVHFKLNF